MLTIDDKSYLKKEFVASESFGKAMDSIGERFDQNETKMDEVLDVLNDIVTRLQRMEGEHGTLIEHGKRLDRIDKKLDFEPLASFNIR